MATKLGDNWKGSYHGEWRIFPTREEAENYERRGDDRTPKPDAEPQR